ncbi:hypothetical protein CL634_06660 [bacterium]|nr:hypothetical protein [bacterium]
MIQSEKIKKLAKHPFTKDVAMLQVSGVTNSAIAFLASLLFARLLGPEEFGFYTLVFALAGFITIFQDTGIGQGTINLLAKSYTNNDKDESRNILASFVRISLLVAVTTGILGIVLAPFIGKFFYNDLNLGKLAGVVVTSSVLLLFYPLANIVLQVVRKIRGLVVIEITNKILMSGLPILLILFGLGVSGIVWGQFTAVILMSLVGYLVYHKLSKTDQSLPAINNFFWKAPTREKLGKFFRFGFSIAINKNILKLVASVPFLMLGFFLATNSGLAFYKVALAYMSLPIVFLGPVSRLLNIQFPKTGVHGEEKMLRRFFQVSGLSVLVVTTITFGLLLVGPYLIDLFYGLQYAPSKTMIYPLALYPIFIGAGVGLGPLFRTLNKIKVAIYINIASLLLMIPTAYWLIGNYAIKGMITTVLIFGLFPNVLSMIYFSFYYKKIKNARS